MPSESPVLSMQASQSLPVSVATAGEALIDLIQQSDGRLNPCNGGAVYNLTRALAQQGVGTLYLNPLSADRFGQGLAHGIAKLGVTLAHTQPAIEPTSLAVVGLDESGKANYSFYREGVADRQVNATQMTAHCAAHSSLKIAVTGCLALVPEDTDKYLPWLKAQRAAGRLVVVDANLRPALVSDMQAYRLSVMAALNQAHIIKVSDDDLDTLGFECNGDPVAAAQALHTHIAAPWLALTLGPKGAMLMHKNGAAWHAVESLPVTVADTVGAGDCFLAGLLVALLSIHSTPSQPQAEAKPLPQLLDWSPSNAEHLLGHAIASASLCVQEVGCTPPSLAQVLERREKNPVIFGSC